MKLKHIAENYGDLEDADEFNDGRCMVCDKVSYYGDWGNCNICDGTLCFECGSDPIVAERAGWVFTPNINEIYCPDCAKQRNRPPQIVESEYGGLEDSDEFGWDPDPCSICGKDDMYKNSWAWCETCAEQDVLISLCSDCGWKDPVAATKAGWLYVKRARELGIEVAYCPAHAKNAPPNAVTPFDYARLNS